MKKNISLVLSFLVVSSCASSKKSCEQIRAALDIGSGSTRVLVASVDVCENKILKVLLKDEKQVAYRDNLKDNELNAETMALGRSVVADYVVQSKNAGATTIKAVATEVFRKAKNGPSFIDSLKKEFVMDVSVIDQEREARLGYLSALTQIPKDTAPFIVWDMGGGSTQIVAFVDGTYKYYFPKYGSVSFKEFIVKEVQKKNLNKVKSPNPIKVASAAKAESLTLKALELGGVPSWLSLILSQGAKVYGIGGVHFYSIREQIDNKTDIYTAAEVEATLKKQLNKTDEKIGGEYSSTQVSNLILIDSFLKFLRVKEVATLKVNLTQGLLFD